MLTNKEVSLNVKRAEYRRDSNDVAAASAARNRHDYEDK